MTKWIVISAALASMTLLNGCRHVVVHHDHRPAVVVEGRHHHHSERPVVVVDQHRHTDREIRVIRHESTHTYRHDNRARPPVAPVRDDRFQHHRETAPPGRPAEASGRWGAHTGPGARRDADFGREHTQGRYREVRRGDSHESRRGGNAAGDRNRSVGRVPNRSRETHQSRRETRATGRHDTPREASGRHGSRNRNPERERERGGKDRGQHGDAQTEGAGLREAAHRNGRARDRD